MESSGLEGLFQGGEEREEQTSTASISTDHKGD